MTSWSVWIQDIWGYCSATWWRHQMETFSDRVTGPLCGEFTGPGEFPTQRPVTRNFDVFFDLRLNKRLSKQPRGCWFETPSWSLWRHCNGKANLSPASNKHGERTLANRVCALYICTSVSVVVVCCYCCSVLSHRLNMCWFVNEILDRKHKLMKLHSNYKCFHCGKQVRSTKIWQLNIYTMTTWHENIFRIIGPLWRESTGEFPLQRVSNEELWWFLYCLTLQIWKKHWSRIICDLRRHDVHMTPMQPFYSKAAEWREFTGGFPSQRASNMETVSISCHHSSNDMMTNETNGPAGTWKVENTRRCLWRPNLMKM